MDLYNFRRQYEMGGLGREQLTADPIDLFEAWLNELIQLNTHDPTAMVLATANGQQQPSQRIVLLKKVDAKGFVFFTNRSSAKGHDIAVNDQVSLLFPWHFISRQVIVKGRAELASLDEDEAYFSTRPKGSQWAAWASPQSQVLSDRDVLMQQYTEVKSQYPDAIPLPEFWGGYRVVPHEIEFWQGRDNRLHDRFVYVLEQNNDWSIKRLAP